MECNEPQCSVQTSQSPASSCECPSCTGENPADFIEKMWHKAAMSAILEANSLKNSYLLLQVVMLRLL